MQQQEAIGKKKSTHNIYCYCSLHHCQTHDFRTIPIAYLLLVLSASEHTQNFIFAKCVPLGVQLLVTQRDIFVHLLGVDKVQSFPL